MYIHMEIVSLNNILGLIIWVYPGRASSESVTNELEIF